MLAGDEFRTLAAEMAGPRPESSSLLLLGLGFARAAEVPGVEHIARQVLKELYERDPERASSFLSNADWEQIQQADGADEARPKLVEAFYEYVSSLSSRLARSSVFRRFYDGFPVRQCYQDVAQLVKGGQFDVVLTTNVDTLLERALDMVGLYAGEDYCVVDLVVDPERERCPSPGDDGAMPVPVIKLHDSWDPGEPTDVLAQVSSLLKSERRLLAVGYDFESQPFDDWLAGSGGDLWWVSAKRPAPQDCAPLEGWTVRYIDASEDRDLTEVFGQLASLASRTRAPPSRDIPANKAPPPPEVKSLTPESIEKERGTGWRVSKADPAPQKGVVVAIQPEGSDAQQPATQPEDSEPQPPATSASGQVNVKPPSKTIPSPGDPAQTVISKDIVSSVFEQWRDDLRAREPRVEEIKSARAAEPLRAQLAQSRETLARLERQRLDRGESDVQLQVQIAYQQDQIAQLEGQLLSVMKDRVVGLIKDIERSVVQSVQSDQVEPGVLSFLQGQRIEVEKQYGQQQPNQDILVAAMGATVLLGERLGDEVVDQRLVRDLASFVPGAMVRRV